MKTSTWVLGGAASVAGAALLGVAWGRRRRRSAVEEYHASSLTALAAETIERGTMVRALPFPEEGPPLCFGDPDVDAMENASIGDEVPGGDTPTPDQDRIDDIGRGYGIGEVDSGELRTSGEILARRDRRRTS